ncbi:MAG: potassium transporter Kup, partial [Sphingomonadaceae bacterium]|nr:potassium transporter Kup [Sphingomonadaceae bacterium]
MLLDTCLLAVLLFAYWKWNKLFAGLLVGLFFIVDGLFFAANLTKIPEGGWFPLLVGGMAFVILTSWAKGRSLIIAQMRETAMPVQVFVKSAAGEATRVPGTAIFMTTSPEGVPHALLHNLKHNKVLHERIVLLTVSILDQPHVAESDRVRCEDLGAGFHRIVLRYGFMQDTDVPRALERVTTCGPPFRMIETSFFLARQTLLSSKNPGMAPWREKIFAWMLRNAESAMQFFRLPTNRVIELGSQVEI